MAAFDRGVVCLEGNRRAAGERAHQHDAAAARARAGAAARRATCAGCRRSWCRAAPARREGHLLDAAEDPDAGVADEPVEAARLADHLVDTALHRRLVAHVHRDPVDAGRRVARPGAAARAVDLEPCAASSRAVAAPMPEEAPVTSLRGTVALRRRDATRSARGAQVGQLRTSCGSLLSSWRCCRLGRRRSIREFATPPARATRSSSRSAARRSRSSSPLDPCGASGGRSGRADLPPNAGMLFALPRPAPLAMVMRLAGTDRCRLPRRAGPGRRAPRACRPSRRVRPDESPSTTRPAAPPTRAERRRSFAIELAGGRWRNSGWSCPAGVRHPALAARAAELRSPGEPDDSKPEGRQIYPSALPSRIRWSSGLIGALVTARESPSSGVDACGPRVGTSR